MCVKFGQKNSRFYRFQSYSEKFTTNKKYLETLEYQGFKVSVYFYKLV